LSFEVISLSHSCENVIFLSCFNIVRLIFIKRTNFVRSSFICFHSCYFLHCIRILNFDWDFISRRIDSSFNHISCFAFEDNILDTFSTHLDLLSLRIEQEVSFSRNLRFNNETLIDWWEVFKSVDSIATFLQF